MPTVKATPELLAYLREQGVWLDNGPPPLMAEPSPESPQPRPRMNKTEARYQAALEERKLLGEVAAFQFESVKLRLAKRTWYTPDFFVILSSGGMEMHEVKGFWREDARCKWKVAAETYPMFGFVAVTREKGKWVQERYG